MRIQQLAKKLSQKLFVLISLSVATTSFSFAVTINNPGFESRFNGWEDIDPSSISSVERSGTRSAKISGAGGRFSQVVSIDPNSSYLLKAYIRGVGTLGANVGGNNSTVNVSSGSSWQLTEVSFSSGSQNSVEIYGVYNGAEGRFDDFSLDKVSSAPPPPSSDPCDNASAQSISGQVQAENYCAMSGVRVENTADTGGGQNVGYIRSGDWTEYAVNIPSAGTYTFTARVASSSSGGTINVANNGSTVASVAVSNTGGWQSWQSKSVSVSLPSGRQKIRLNYSGGNGFLFNLNWFSLSAGSNPPPPPPPPSSDPCDNASAQSISGQVQAENYCAMNGVRVENTADTGGGQNVGYIQNGDWTEYAVNIPSAGTYTFTARVASSSSGGTINVANNGSTVASVAVSNTGNWQSWQSKSVSVSLPSGRQKIRLNYSGGNGFLFNLNWFSLSAGSNPPPPPPPPPPPSGGLDPSVPPSGNFELIDWNISVPIDNNNDGKADTIKEVNLADGYSNSNYFYTANDGGMVFRTPPTGPKTSSGTKFVRTELREMLRRGNTSIKTQGITANNWVFGSAPSSDRNNAGGVDGILRGTLEINDVTTTGDAGQVGRVIFAQIHANDDEPIRFYYRKLPGNSKGSIYFAHESRNASNDIYFEMIGSRSRSQSNPADGIALNERFSYEIKVVGNNLTVRLIRPNKADLVETVNMNNSGYDTGGQYMYFKAGSYVQDNTANSNDFTQVTYYALDNIH